MSEVLFILRDESFSKSFRPESLSFFALFIPTPSPFVLCGRGLGRGEDPGVDQLGRPGGSGLAAASRHPACLPHLSLWQLLAGFWG